MLRKQNLILIFSIIVALLTCSFAAHGGNLRGQIDLSPKYQQKPSFYAPGFWSLPNNILPLREPLIDPRMEMVVTLEGKGLPVKGDQKPEIRIIDAQFVPTVLPVRLNVPVVFINDDSIHHIIEPAVGKFMPVKRLSAGSKFTHQFKKIGSFEIHSSEIPHLHATILVVDAPQTTVPSSSGAFSFNGLPVGLYALKIWYQGNWIHSESYFVKGWSKIDIMLNPKQKKGKD